MYFAMRGLQKGDTGSTGCELDGTFLRSINGPGQHPAGRPRNMTCHHISPRLSGQAAQG